MNKNHNLKWYFILCMLLSIGTIAMSNAEQWSHQTTLSDGSILYSEVSTDDISVSSTYLCKCSYSIKWYCGEPADLTIVMKDTTQFHIYENTICFTSHPQEYSSNNSWNNSIIQMTKEQIKKVESSLIIDWINRKSPLNKDIIKKVPLSGK